MDQGGHHGGLGVARLDAGAAVGAELCGSVADRGQCAQHQQLTLGQGEPAAGVEVAEAELGEEPRQCRVERLGQVGQVVLDLVAVQGCLDSETLRVPLGVGDGALVRQGQRDALALKTSLIVATPLSVRGKPMKGASW